MSNTGSKITKPRDLQSVEEVLSSSHFKNLIEEYSHTLVAVVIKETVSDFREKIKQGLTFSASELFKQVEKNLKEIISLKISPVINATGVILHTNLGRAPFCTDIGKHLQEITTSFINLELDLESGKRSIRGEFVEKLLFLLTAAESSLVVNNNASAVLLCLSALAKGKEVLISRGELLQIGGGFKIPEILELSGATLKEVGTTNKTSLEDYQKNITPKTGLILKIHKSNFVQKGFVEEASVKELTDLGREFDLPVVYDLGSGALINTRKFGIAQEPEVGQAIADGVDLSCFSGDKLLGGPQAGIISGRKKYMEILRNHAFYRAFRCDKIILAVLEETLLAYLKKQEKEKILVWKLISTSEQELRKRAEDIISKVIIKNLKLLAKASHSSIGGGSLPEESLPTRVLVFDSGILPYNLATAFRKQNPPIIGRIEEERFVLDLRTILPEQDESVIKSIHKVFSSH